MTENEMGMLPMETIKAGHNDSLALFKKQGKILVSSYPPFCLVTIDLK